MIFSAKHLLKLPPAPCAVIGAAALCAGCGQEEIRVYQVPKPQPERAASETPGPARPSAGEPHREQTAPASARAPSWTVPPGWQQEPPTQMVTAKFSIRGPVGHATVTVSSFPGEAGGLLANVNRWRGQVSLPAIDAAELAQVVGSLEMPAGAASVVDLTGVDAATGRPARLITVVLPRAGQTWFFKLMGDEPVVAREKAAFLKFVQGMSWPDAS